MPISIAKEELSNFLNLTEGQSIRISKTLGSLEAAAGSISTSSGLREVKIIEALGQLDQECVVEIAFIAATAYLLNEYDYEGKDDLLKHVKFYAEDLKHIIDKGQDTSFKEKPVLDSELQSSLDSTKEALAERAQSVNRLIQGLDQSISFNDVLKEINTVHKDLNDKFDQVKKDLISTKSGKRKVVPEEDLNILNERLGYETKLIKSALDILKQPGIEKNQRGIEQVTKISSELQEVVDEQKALFGKELRSNPEEQAESSLTSQKAKKTDKNIKKLSSGSGEIEKVEEKKASKAEKARVKKLAKENAESSSTRQKAKKMIGKIIKKLTGKK